MPASVAAEVGHVLRRLMVWLGRHRFLAALAGCAIVAVAAAVAFFVRSTAPVPLFGAPLRPAQVQEVEQALTLWDEPFSSSASGTQVLVTASRRRALLLRLALGGLPHRYVLTSADVLEQPQNVLAPLSVSDDRRLFGIEGDLVAGLRRIDGVADASVLIASGGVDPFGDPQRTSPPTAGVQLVVKPGSQLSAAQVAGVKRFVAAAYPGLMPERVTVVDGSGALAAVAQPADRSLVKELRVQSAVQSALETALGAGVAVVRANVKSSGAAQSVQSTRVVPHGLLEEDTGREKGTEGGRGFEKQRAVRRWAYDTIVERRTAAPDVPVRISVAVLVDELRVAADKRPAIEGMVRAAAGADLKAGDEVNVQFVPFSPRLAPMPHPPGRAWVQPNAFAATGLAGGGLAAAALFAAIVLRCRRERRQAAQAAADARAIAESLDLELPRTAAYVLRSLPLATRERVLQAYEPERRAAIECHLEPSEHG